MKKLIISLLAASCVLLPGQQPLFAGATQDEQAPNIIIVTISGVRRCESIDDPQHQYMPLLWGKLIPEGALYSDVVDANLEFHMPTVHAINTGKNHYVLGPISVPSIFQYIRKQLGWPASKVWSIGHWKLRDVAFNAGENELPCLLQYDFASLSDELKKILTPEELEFVSRYNALQKALNTWPNWNSISSIQHRMFRKIIREYKPKFVHYVMGATEAGHFDTYGSYALSVQDCDAMIFDIWQFIQQDPYYKGRTYLFVSSDHDRNLFFRHHYDRAYDNPSHVWLYCYGPGIGKGRTINRQIQHVDIFATVAEFLKLQVPPSEGKPLSDAFVKE